MGSKAREGAKAMSLAFVLLDFQQVPGGGDVSHVDLAVITPA